VTAVSDLFLGRWASGQHVGAAKPTSRVQIRRGRFNRRYAPWAGEQFGRIAGRSEYAPQWQAFWTPGEPYAELPNHDSIEITQSFDNNGVATATVTMDNLAFVELTGPAGAYHLRRKGLYAPLFGYTAPGRRGIAGVTQNEWFQRLNSKAQITVWEGYGDAIVKSFTGLIDDLDVTAKPGQVVITARDYGQVLTDERFFGWVMDRDLRDPITFYPTAGVGEKVGGGPEASSSLTGYPPRFVLDQDGDTFWLSDGQGDPAFTEWVQIHLPAGRYSEFYMHPQFDGMEVFVSLYARHRGAVIPRHCYRDGVMLESEDLAVDHVHGGIPEGFVRGGLGAVPGENGGEPYIRHIPVANAVGRRVSLGATYELGADSVLRLSFRNLAASTTFRPPYRTRYRAGLKRLTAFRTSSIEQDAKKASTRRYVLVDDASDIVRVCLRWAGFKEWEVEQTGVQIAEPYVVEKSVTLMDAINKVKELTGFAFFMAGPDDDDLSLGIPVFRKARIYSPIQQGVPEVRDTSVLTDLKQKFSDEPLRYIIRVRGAQVPTVGKQQIPKGGMLLGGDKVKRFMYVYRPPWEDRMGGVIRHVTQYDATLQSRVECEIGAYLLAANIALANATAQFSVPGTPHIGLDQMVSVIDAGTGHNARVYIATLRRTLQRGEHASYQADFGGAIPDTPDVREVVSRLNDALGRRV
jgi:hypothetical protein